MAAANYDCLCAGIIVADFICEPIDAVPSSGGLVLTGEVSVATGGCASNVAVDLTRLGCRAAVAGCVGADPPGQFVRQALAEAGVETRWVREAQAVRTSATLVINVRGEDRRFVHAIGANGVFDASELTAEVLRSARVLYLGGFLLMPHLLGEPAARLFRLAREAGVRTVLDVVVPAAFDGWPELEPVLPWTDVFLPNVDEARQLTGLDDPWKQADAFRRAGAETVVITLGGRGAVLVSSRERLQAEAYPVEFIDGTGSGDAFAAGFIAGLLEERTPAECLETGSALGASCVRQAGATTGVFTRAELEAFLEHNRLAITAITAVP